MQVIVEAVIVAIAVMGISVLIVAPGNGPVADARDAVIRWAWSRTVRPCQDVRRWWRLGEWVEGALECPPCLAVWISFVAVPAVWWATGNWWLLASPGIAVFGLHLWRDLRGRHWRSVTPEEADGGGEVGL